ncbi:MAG: DUF1150 family protein [Ferrovibrio sp.]|nr:DUF1150 family protein [Ferrovibrio sp.]
MAIPSNNDNNIPAAKPASLAMTPEAFANLGAPQLAYIRPVQGPDGAEIFGIFSASGQQLGYAPERDLAFAAARQHELEPVSLQ